MSNKEKINICKDVIAQINARKLKIDTGAYVNAVDDITVTGDPKIIIPFVQQHCSVCARGALMLRKFALYDYDCSIDTASVDQEDTRDQLESIFDEEELNLIEAAFEGKDCSYNWCNQSEVNKADLEAAFIFYKDHKKPADRLIAIMQNIIDHGRFIPYVRYTVS